MKKQLLPKSDTLSAISVAFHYTLISLLILLSVPNADAKQANILGYKYRKIMRNRRHEQHLSRRKEALKQAKIKQALATKKLSLEQKQQLCLRVRGWVATTPALIGYLERVVLKQAAWSDHDLRFIRFWLDYSMGYALVPVFDQLQSPHKQEFLQLLATEYSEDVRCPLVCSYADYTKLLAYGQMESKSKLDAFCQPRCMQDANIESDAMQYLQTTAAEVSFCDCMLAADADDCDPQYKSQRKQADRMQMELASEQQRSLSLEALVKKIKTIFGTKN